MSAGAPVIAGYEQLVPIGQGGVGDVYRAVDATTGAAVAIKVMRDVTDQSAAWRRCRRELTALLALGGHPHVIAVLDVVAAGPAPALVMELAPGGSLVDVVTRRGSVLSAGEAVRVGTHAATALVATHTRGIVHRDVKPHNLLVDDAGTVKLCDFGIAAVRRSPEFRHATASVSSRFASPEDLEGDRPVGPPADVYSLGATLLYLVHGEQLELRDRLIRWEPPPAVTDADAALDRLIAECLQPEPGDRPPTAALHRRLVELDRDFGRALDRAPAVGPDTLPRPIPGHRPLAAELPPRPSPAGPRPGRRRALLAGLAALVAVVALAGWWLADGRSTQHAAASVEIVARPAGLVDVRWPTWPSGPVGECLAQQPGVGTLVRVECADPHDLERVGFGSLADRADGAFSAADVDATVDAACATAARQRATAGTGEVDLAVAVTRPSAGGWRAGDRSYQCFVGLPDRRLVGSAAAD